MKTSLYIQRYFFSALILFFSLPALYSQSSLNFSISTSSIYSPGDEIKLNLYSYDYNKYKEKDENEKFDFSVFRIKDINAFFSNQISRYNIEVLGKDSTNLLYLTDKVLSFEKYLNAQKEYQYWYINETIPLNISSKGAYLVRVMTGNKIAYCGFIISDLGIISKAGNNSMLGFVVDRKTGNPVTGAELNFYLGQKKIGEGKTSDGIYYQAINEDYKAAKDENMIPMIIGKYNEDIFVSDSYLYFGYSGDKYYTYIFTEQPVYRTGSEVNYKATIRQNNFSKLEPVKYKDVTVIIKDSKNAEVYKEVLKTNEMGSIDGKFKIEEEAALGGYNIFVNIDENNSYSESFDVEQYKKPEYKVTVQTGKGQYYGNDNMTADIEAKYFFGSPVTGAEVEYNIYKTRFYKPWWMFSEYSWWYKDYYENQEDNQKYNGADLIYSGKGVLDNEGKLTIDYRINEDFKNDDDYRQWYRPYYYDSDYKYIIQAKVTDKSRREISGTAAAFVTRGGFSLSAKSDKYLYKPGESVSIEVYASDFADKPVETTFEAVIYKTQWENDSRKEKKDFIKSLTGNTKKDGKGIITFDLNNNEAEGAYNVEIKAKDERSNQILTSAYFYVSEGRMWWYYNESGSIQIIPDKDSYKQGEICHAMIINTNENVSVLVSTSSDDILSYTVEKFTGTTKMIDIPITEKYNSGFEISVNYVYNGTFYNQTKNILVIPEEKFLTVQIDPSKLIYKPKETGSLKVRITDNYGNPVSNAEVSIGIVDESIYSIKEDKTKDIRKFFYGQRFANISTAYNSGNQSSGQSRLITIYERFNIKTIKENELATVKGRLLRKNGESIPNAVIVIDEDFQAAVTDQDGNFEFKLPAGDYSIGAYYRGITKDDLKEINLYKGQTKTITLYNNKEMNEMETRQSVSPLGFESRNGRVDEEKSMSDGVLQDAPKKKMMKGEDTEDKDGAFVQADVRSDFRDAIFWSPYSVTDGDGYATVEVKYPDNLTTWRITSRVITEDTKVGQVTTTVLTRKDLLVRMEAPRFMQENDIVTISTIIHNYLSSGKKTRIKFTAENAELLEVTNEKTLSIAPDTDERIDWKVRVKEPSGEAKLYAEALTNEESDAVEIKIPLQPRGLKMIENTIADFSDDIKTEIKSVNIPQGSDLRSADLKFTVDPSLASTILTALDELAGYPYGCVEQTMSRFLPTVVVADAFREINAPISEATKKDLPKMVDKGLQRLYGFQHSDGGWGWWENDGSNPFMTAYVIYGFSLAKKAGYDIREGIVSKGITAMKTQLMNKDIDATTRAYMLYSIAVAEEKDEEFFKKEIEKITGKDMNDYGRSLIAMTWKIFGNNQKAEDALRELEKNAKMTGEGAAYWEGKQFHYQWQDDKVQTTAMALKAIVDINSTSDLKDKVIRWLMMQRQGMSWRNTQETAMIIYAMVDYLKNSNELKPDYNIKVYVNSENVYEKRLTSEDIFKKSTVVRIDNKYLRSGQNEIKIEKTGVGKVYFSAYTTYYESNENIGAREDGFRIEREYFKLEKYNSYMEDKITYRKKNFDGKVNSGDEILVKLRVYSKDNENQYFMLEDALPSGVEVIKDDWAYQIEDENNYKGYDYYFWRWWYADKEVRDNRVTFFVTYLGKGEYEFSYIMRAQIPGEYTVNPSKGMLMYYPEVYGSSTSMRLIINDK